MSSYTLRSHSNLYSTDIECSNERFLLELGLYDKPFANDMNAQKSQVSGRGILAHIRNIVINQFLRPHHDLVLWIDADVVEYPNDLVQRLYNANPGGITGL